MEPAEFNSKEREDFEALFYSSIATASKLIEDFRDGDDRRSNQSGQSTSEGAIVGNQNSIATQDMVKLPTINLPKFYGDY